jgi:hypothetical protein
MIVTYLRAGGMQPPPDREELTIENDGSFRLWRSVGWATYPPTAIGLFAGKLEPETVDALKGEVAAANKVGKIKKIPMPGSAVEEINTGKARAEILDYVELETGWKELVERLRQMLHDLTASPRAAIELHYLTDKNELELVQLGTTALKLDLSELAISARHMDKKTYSTVAEWKTNQNMGKITAEPGWVLNLPIKPDFTLNEDSEVLVFATFTIFDGNKRVPISIQAV